MPGFPAAGAAQSRGGWARGDANKKSACLAAGQFASVHAGEGVGGISARQTTTKSALVRDKSRADRREMDAGSWAAAIGVIEQLAGVRLVDDAVAPFPYQGCSLLRTADIFGLNEVLSRACAYCYRNTCCEAPAPERFSPIAAAAVERVTRRLPCHPRCPARCRTKHQSTKSAAVRACWPTRLTWKSMPAELSTVPSTKVRLASLS